MLAFLFNWRDVTDDESFVDELRIILRFFASVLIRRIHKVYIYNENLGISMLYVGEGDGNPVQYSCLENPRDRGAWWAYSPWGGRVYMTGATQHTCCMYSFCSFPLILLDVEMNGLLLIYLSIFLYLMFGYLGF